MSDTVTAALEGLRIRERELELDACAVKARIEEIRDMIGLLEHGPRRRPGRPRNASALNPIVQMPDRVPGALHQPEEGTAA